MIMKKHLIFCLTAFMITTVTLWFIACKNNNDPVDPNAQVYAPTSKPFGKSYVEWTVDWMTVFATFDCAGNPWLNPAYVLFYQTGPVYFMAGLNTPGASVNVTVPQDKAILFPLINYINDYPCPDTSWHPAPGQTLKEFLTPGAVDPMALATNMSVTIDGDSISNPAGYLFTTDLFYFTGNPELANVCNFDVCITGNSQAAVSSGYYMMLKPLSKGTHTVHYHVEVPVWSAIQDGTYHITVN